MKRFISILAALALTVCCFTACAKGSSSSSNERVNTLEDELTSSQKIELLDIANENARHIESAVWEVLLNSPNSANSSDISYKTPKPVAVESFENSNDPVEKKVYECLKSRGVDDLGYVYIDVDINSSNGGFIQWAESENSSIIGQRPHSPSSYEQSAQISFGVFYNDDSSSETTTTHVTEEEPVEETTTAMVVQPSDPEEEARIAEAFASKPKATNCFSSSISGISSNKAAISDDGSKVYFLAGKIENNEYDGGKCVLYCYSIKDKKTSKILELNDDILSFAYFKNKIYITRLSDESDYELYIGMFDENGKKIKEVTDKTVKYSQRSDAVVLDNGMIAVLSASPLDDDSKEISLLFQADLSKPVEVWREGSNGNEHNIKSKEKPDGTTNIGFYYCYSDEKTERKYLSLYNVKSKSWKEFEVNYGFSNISVRQYGKYVFILPRYYDREGIDERDPSTVIIDYETGEQSDYTINYNYKGGEYAYAYESHSYNSGENGEWYKCKPVKKIEEKINYTLVSSQKVPDNFGSYAENGDHLIYVLNNKYYWYYDNDYGFFLRTFESGDAKEETVFLFDNNE